MGVWDSGVSVRILGAYPALLGAVVARLCGVSVDRRGNGAGIGSERPGTRVVRRVGQRGRWRRPVAELRSGPAGIAGCRRLDQTLRYARLNRDGRAGRSGCEAGVGGSVSTHVTPRHRALMARRARRHGNDPSGIQWYGSHFAALSI